MPPTLALVDADGFELVGADKFGVDLDCESQCCGPVGACCLPNGTCVGTPDQAACTALGGAWQGDGSSCATAICPTCCPSQGGDIPRNCGPRSGCVTAYSLHAEMFNYSSIQVLRGQWIIDHTFIGPTTGLAPAPSQTCQFNSLFSYRRVVDETRFDGGTAVDQDVNDTVALMAAAGCVGLTAGSGAVLPSRFPWLAGWQSHCFTKPSGTAQDPSIPFVGMHGVGLGMAQNRGTLNYTWRVGVNDYEFNGTLLVEGRQGVQFPWVTNGTYTTSYLVRMSAPKSPCSGQSYRQCEPGLLAPVMAGGGAGDAGCSECAHGLVRASW